MAVGDRVTGQEFDLASANLKAEGIAVNATYAYVVDSDDRRVYVYRLSDGARRSGEEFTLALENNTARGIAVSSTYAYVVDEADFHVYVYRLSDGARQTSQEFAIHSDNGQATGISVDATYAYVVDGVDAHVYVYRLSDGARQTGQEFDLASVNAAARGIAVNATYAYFIDRDDTTVYVQRLSDGARQTGQEFNLTTANVEPRGIAVSSIYAYVADANQEHVYVYSITTPAVAPGAPSTPSLTPGINQIAVSWNAPSSPGTDSISSYDVRYRIGSGSWTTIDPATSGTRSYTITGLTGGTAYQVQVRAVSDAGNGSWSSTATATATAASADVPGQPDAPTITISGTRYRVAWDAPSNTGPTITEYEARRRYTTQTAYSHFTVWETGDGALEGDGGRYSVTGDAGSTTEWAVRAINSAGNGPWSDSTFFTAPAAVPGAPSIVSITPSTRQLTVVWSAPSSDGGADIDSYDVRHRVSPSGSYTTINPATSGALTYTILNLVGGETYDVQVRAVNSAGNGAWSTEDMGTTPSTVPGAPTNVDLTADEDSIAVTWSAPSSDGGQNISGYDVRYRIQNQSWTTIDPATAGTRSYTIENLSAGETYDVQVRAVNSVGNSAWSTTESATTSTTIPGKPTILALVPSDQSINVQWSAPDDDGGDDIDTYDVRYRIGNSGSYTTINPATTGSTLSYTLSSLTNDSEYEIQVRAVNSSGNGPWSDTSTATPTSGATTPVIVVTPPPTTTINVESATPDISVEPTPPDVIVNIPEAPAAVTVTAPVVPGKPTISSVASESHSLSIRWSEPSNEGTESVDYYDLRIRSSVEWTLVDRASTDLEHDLRGLANDVEFDIQVRAVSAAGAGLWSDIYKATPTTERVARVGFIKIVQWDTRMWGITENGILYSAFDFDGGWAVAASIPVHATPVTDMFVFKGPSNQDVLHVMTETGLWYYDVDVEVFKALDVPFPRSGRNGGGSVVWESNAYIPIGNGVYRFSGGQNPVLSRVGPDLDQGLPWDGDSRIVKLVPSQNDLLAVVQNLEEDEADPYGTSHILAYDTTGWQVLWSAEDRVTLQDVFVTSTLGDYSVWFGYDDLKVIDLPEALINPSRLHHRRRYQDTGYTITPWVDAYEPETRKVGLEIKALITGVSATKTVKIEYALDYDESTWTEVATVTEAGLYGWRLPLNDDNKPGPGLVFDAIRFRVTLVTDDAETTPDLRMLGLEFKKHLEAKWGFTIQPRLDEVYKGQTPKQMRDWLIELANQPELKEFVYRSEAGQNVVHWVDIDADALTQGTGADNFGLATVQLAEL